MKFHQKNVLIVLKGVQRADGERDVVELSTLGKYYKLENGVDYLTYEESETTGFEGCTTILKMEGNRRVTITRTGDNLRTELIVERGVRNQCSYETDVGALTMGICGERIINTLQEQGGKLELHYTLDINTSLASENELYITVKEC